jgi:hypothetical protein
LEIDGDKVESKVCGIGGGGAVESEGVEMGEHVVAFSCVDRETAAGEKENCTKVFEDVGSGLMDG